jgi:hypothetical protein
MISRIPILLDERTAAGLVALAKQEFRDPRQQAAVIIRDELVRRGLLQAEPEPMDKPSKSEQGEHNVAS